MSSLPNAPDIARAPSDTAPAPAPTSLPEDVHLTALRHLDRLTQALKSVPARPLAEAIDLLIAARLAGRRVWVFGNGGSAAIASHLACDLIKTATRPGEPVLRTTSLTDNVPLLSALANDFAYERVFAAQVEMHVDPDDVVIAISSSGRSPNIVAGVTAAKERGARTIALVGFDGGPTLNLADVVVHVAVDDYGIVEDAHAAVGHAIAAAVRSAPIEREPH